MADSDELVDSEETAVPVNNKSKSKPKPKFVAEDNFLSDAIAPPRKHLTYQDGFRLGVGLTMGFLFIAVILGGLTTAVVFGLRYLQ